MKVKRISAFLAACGIASRRTCEKMVLEGKIKINNQVVKELSFKVAPEDNVEFNGKHLKIITRCIVAALNKPCGYICTVRDNFNRKTVMNLVTELHQRLYPAGRLDADSRGLLILTNDGNIAYKITHPSFEIPKTYIVKIPGEIKKSDINKLAGGIEIEEKIFTPLNIEKLETFKNKTSLKARKKKTVQAEDDMKEDSASKNHFDKNPDAKDFSSSIRITISEGRKRIIRKAFSSLGYKVVDLKRVQIGKYKLGNLKEGKYRILGDNDIKALLSK